MTDKSTLIFNEKAELCPKCNTKLDIVFITEKSKLIKIGKYCTNLDHDNTMSTKSFFDEALENALDVNEKNGLCPKCNTALALSFILKESKRMNIGQYCTECKFFTTFIPASDGLVLS
jgi:uncharacterized protein (UPF0212 family)